MDLKKLREDAGLTQQEAAEKLGVGRSTVYRAESGRTKRLDHAFVERAKELYLAAKAG